MIEWARSPWGQDIPIHVSFFLMWVFGIAAFVFLIIHAIYVRYFAKHQQEAAIPADVVARTPVRIAKYSGAARAFHWIMALAMFALLFTAFLPKVGVEFPWVTWHWIAGLVLTASIIFHIIHASFFMDFWSIWPDRIDIEDAIRRFKRATGESAPAPRKFGKYPLENKGYHGIILLTGLAVTITGVFMMKRVHTPFFVRNPYLFSDMTWGLMYVLHGLAGVGLIALTMVHVYFAVRPEKLVQTKAMIFGSLPRDFYLDHHDPERWKPEPAEK